jgi:hypothetical protein
MVSLIDEGMLNDAVLNGFANTILIEVGKRWPKIPLDPTNKNQVKAISAALCLVLAVVNAGMSGNLSVDAIGTSIRYVLRLWVMGWVISHAAYQAAPGLQAPKTPSA